jgi:hypothetical protein
VPHDDRTVAAELLAMTGHDWTVRSSSAVLLAIDGRPDRNDAKTMK